MDKTTFNHAKEFMQKMELQASWSDEQQQQALFYLEEALAEVDRSWKGLPMGLEHPLHNWDEGQ